MTQIVHSICTTSLCSSLMFCVHRGQRGHFTTSHMSPMSPPAACQPCHSQLHVSRVTPSCMSPMSLPAACHPCHHQLHIIYITTSHTPVMQPPATYPHHHQSHVPAPSHPGYQPVSVLLQEVVLNTVHQAVKARHHGWLLHWELNRYHIAAECLEVLRRGEGGGEGRGGGRRGEGRGEERGGEGGGRERGGKDEEGDTT